MKYFILLCTFSIVSCVEESWAIVDTPSLYTQPCIYTSHITVSFEPQDEENQYDVNIKEDLSISTEINFQFDAEAIVTLNDDSFAKLYRVGDENQFQITLFEAHDGISFKVEGVVSGVTPLFKSFDINSRKYCAIQLPRFRNRFKLGKKVKPVSHAKRKNTSCGRRKVSHTELIVNGASTKPGDWPWHVAIYRLEKSVIKYICGGNLISKSFVLTAAHCTTIRGVKVLPEILSVVLAKYNLIGGDIASQERTVHEVIVHDGFDAKILEHDISLLKLLTVAVYDDYIQPACIWQSTVVEYLPSVIEGTVVGWGFDQTDSLSPKLLQASLPILPDTTCIRKNPVFYSKLLTENKFCAGLSNGTSPCNGDSGGGFLVFVPDEARDESENTSGSWYVRGIVSLTKSKSNAPICDPDSYVIFTDVAKYKSWIDERINND